jgi:hypothetical protein
VKDINLCMDHLSTPWGSFVVVKTVLFICSVTWKSIVPYRNSSSFYYTTIHVITSCSLVFQIHLPMFTINGIIYSCISHINVIYQNNQHPYLLSIHLSIQIYIFFRKGGTSLPGWVLIHFVGEENYAVPGSSRGHGNEATRPNVY